ncbi:aminotransferase class V-fold PLP-dependent enzyme [Stenotrophomonas rhizophila]|uniref:aminotransferase class V-fold PLP-dependent enzyme n=1 Tax=Stenotrophomonas rhizophila TaxID=216778 RepID=UPI001E34E9B1|nr:aminotransferase class V-fold PLP-dependent enzyme [Stenotrophomonas rhizophila]MCC7634949.1 aminotransferase class V-fold PLP-dependent enzyme [Stenotrophomonas rhizophila]MCC7664268.1 aminotransferase class V-fold PLP-dependent enzyme [Stenotrophomonas rhizophila]
MDRQRRHLLRGALALPVAGAGAAMGTAMSAELPAELPALPPVDARTPAQLAGDEAWWGQVRALYDLTDEVVMLDNGYWGAMARPVLQAYQQATATVNAGNAWFGRLAFPPLFEQARVQLAQALGVDTDEIALTRGATEAMQALIGGYNKLGPGDTVLYADTDYDSMIAAMQWLRARRGVDVQRLVLPEPFDHDSIVDAYRQALARHPRTRLLLLTQVNHRNGMLLPVAQIAALARAAGAEVILDAAHGIGQVDTPVRALGVDFIGINLHKWIGAPVGVGAIYVRRGRVRDLDPYMGEADHDDIRTRIHTGTVNFAAYMALPLALQLHQRIGVANKRARLLHLRNLLLDALRGDDRVQLLASADPRLSSAIAGFRLRGQTTLAANTATATAMVKQAGVFVVPREGLASGACLRATPGIFSTPAQMQALVRAVRAVAG